MYESTTKNLQHVVASITITGTQSIAINDAVKSTSRGSCISFNSVVVEIACNN